MTERRSYTRDRDARRARLKARGYDATALSRDGAQRWKCTRCRDNGFIVQAGVGRVSCPDCRGGGVVA